MHHCKKMRGYSLIEVLVAFTILGLTLTVLIQIFATGIRNIDVSAEYSVAVLVAENMLAAPGVSDSLRPGQTRGVEAGNFSWTRTISEFSPPEQTLEANTGIDAYRIVVDVEWPAHRTVRHIALETIRLDLNPAVTGRN